MDSELHKLYRWHAAHSCGWVGNHAREALSYARAETLFQACKRAGVARFRWEPDDDVDLSWTDDRMMAEIRAGHYDCLQLVLEILTPSRPHCDACGRGPDAAQWSIADSLGGIVTDGSDVRMFEAQMAHENRDALREALSRAERG